MRDAQSTDFQNNFGYYLEEARKAPIRVSRSKRPVAVLLSIEEYERLEACEDAYWVARAREAEKSGFLGPEKSMDYMIKRMGETA